jgi:tetratricopeptide (TPR) repeat protein
LRALRLAPILLAGVSCLAFLPALTGEFVHWDDDVNLVANPHFRGLGWAQLRWMFTATLLGHWIPLTWLTFGLNYVLGGMDPWGYHLGNLLLHGFNVALVYLLARRLLLAGWPPVPPQRRGQGEGSLAIALGAATAAVLFGVHPLRVESVAWVTERRDVLCSAFYLLAVLAYLRGVERGGLLRGWGLVASLAAFAAALMSKAMAMTLPVSLLVLDVYPLRRWSVLGGRAVVGEKRPYLALSAASSVVALVALSQGSPPTGYETYGVGARVAMVGYSLWFYPWKLVWPSDLSPLYELPARVDLLDWRFLGPLLLVAGVTVALVVLAPRWPAGLAAWVHSAVVLAPVSGVVHAGHQLAHDRYSYLSALGFAVLAGAGMVWVLSRSRAGALGRWVRAAVVATAGLVALGWATGAWRQSEIWRDSETLWRAAVDADGDCAICRNNLAATLMEGHPPASPRLVEAEIYLRQAVRLRPRYADAYRTLATLLSNQGRYREAEGVLRDMVRLLPHLADGPPRLAAVLAAEGRHDEAVVVLRAALATSPDRPKTLVELGHALNNHGIGLASAGRLAEAAGVFAEASRILPNDVMPLENLGRVLVEQGQAAEAVAPLQRAVGLDSQSAVARFWLARAYLSTGQHTRAEAEIDALRRRDPVAAAQVRARP